MQRVALTVCWLVLLSLSVGSQTAEWAIWDMASTESFPGELIWMIDDSPFVALHAPTSLARFEPNADRLLIWPLGAGAGGVVWTNSGLLFTMPFAAQVGWLQPDANYVQTWSMPSPMARPVFAYPASYGHGIENMWYLDWETGRLGLFEPTGLPASIEAGPAPQVLTVARTSGTARATTQTATPEIVMADPGLVPAVYIHEPTVTAEFREWGLVTMDPPPYALLEDRAGNVWVPDVVNNTLLSLSPIDSVVTVYDLPVSLFIASLAAVPGATDIYFLARQSDSVTKIGVLQPEDGSIALWTIPGSSDIDATSLIVSNEALWFCDREGSAVYRFVPMLGEFTWWETGGDDAPHALVSGKPGEFWMSWERTGKIARLRIP